MSTFLFFTGNTFSITPSVALLLGAAIVEESARLIFLIQLAKQHPRATSIFHAIFFALGFIVAELSLLALSPADLPDFSLVAKMALVHLLGTAILYMGLRYQKNAPLSPYVALFLAVLFHTLYNASL